MISLFQLTCVLTLTAFAMTSCQPAGQSEPRQAKDQKKGAANYPFPMMEVEAKRQPDGSVLISWQPDARNQELANYVIQRNFSPLAEAGPEATRYLDAEAPNGETVYQVIPVNADGLAAIETGLYFRLGIRPDKIESGFSQKKQVQAIMASPFVTGLDLFLFWNELEPEKGEYNWAYFDEILAELVKHRKKAKLTVYPSQNGTFAPWQKESFTFYADVPREGQIKLDGRPQTARQRVYPLDPHYRKAWREFWVAFAERYRGHPAMSSVDLPGPSAHSTHPRIPVVAQSLQKWKDWGWTREAWRQAWLEDGRHFLEIWDTTPVSLNSGLHAGLGPEFLRSIYEPLYAEYGNRVLLRNEAANGNKWYLDPQPGSSWSRYREYYRAVAERAAVGYEMWKFSWARNKGGKDRGPNGPMHKALEAALTDGGTWVHIWPQDFQPPYFPLYRRMAERFGLAIVPPRTFQAGDEYDDVDNATLQDALTGDGRLGPVTVKIDPNQVVREVPKALMGFNMNWLWSEASMVDPETREISEYFLEVLKGMPVPLGRMSGSVSQSFRWKQMLGDPAKRQPYEILPNRRPRMQDMGVLEWVDAMHRLDPDGELNFVLNMTEDSADDHADLARLFLAGEDDEWGRQRMDDGLKEPVRIAIWELGNEMDWQKHAIPHDEYIKRSKAAIRAIREVDPDAKFAAQVATAPWSKKYREEPGGWAAMHRLVLKELGDDIDYLTIHPYYHGLSTAALAKYFDVIRDDIVALTGSDRIKIHVSEHARWPPRPEDPKANRFALKHLTHSLSGCLATAEFLNRMVYRPEVAAAAYHCLAGGPWKVYGVDEATGRYYATGIKPLFQLLARAFNGVAVKVQIKGKQTQLSSKDLSFTLSAIKRSDGGLNLLAVNRDTVANRPLEVELPGPYRVTRVSTLTAEAMEDHNGVEERPIQVRRELLSPPRPVSQGLEVPAKSVVLFELAPAAEAESLSQAR